MQPNRKALANGLPYTPIPVNILSQLCFIVFLNFYDYRNAFNDTPLIVEFYCFPFGEVNGLTISLDECSSNTLVSNPDGDPYSITLILKVFFSYGKFIYSLGFLETMPPPAEVRVFTSDSIGCLMSNMLPVFIRLNSLPRRFREPFFIFLSNPYCFSLLYMVIVSSMLGKSLYGVRELAVAAGLATVGKLTSNYESFLVTFDTGTLSHKFSSNLFPKSTNMGSTIVY